MFNYSSCLLSNECTSKRNPNFLIMSVILEGVYVPTWYLLLSYKCTCKRNLFQLSPHFLIISWLIKGIVLVPSLNILLEGSLTITDINIFNFAAFDAFVKLYLESKGQRKKTDRLFVIHRLCVNLFVLIMLTGKSDVYVQCFIFRCWNCNIL